MLNLLRPMLPSVGDLPSPLMAIFTPAEGLLAKTFIQGTVKGEDNVHVVLKQYQNIKALELS